jgi:hypothetical protein
MRLLWLVPLVCGCLLPDPDALDCEAIALRSSDGSIDACDDAACGACVGTCGGQCFVVDEFPPQYNCEEYVHWSASDLCENWRAR